MDELEKLYLYKLYLQQHASHLSKPRQDIDKPWNPFVNHKRSDFNVGFLNKVTANGAKGASDRNMLKQFYGGSIGPG